MSSILLGTILSLFGGDGFKTLLDQKLLILLTTAGSIAIDHFYSDSGSEGNVTTHYTVPAEVLNKSSDQQCLHVHLNEPAKLKIIHTRLGTSLLQKLQSSTSYTVSSMANNFSQSTKSNLHKAFEKTVSSPRKSILSCLIGATSLAGLVSLLWNTQVHQKVEAPQPAIYETTTGQIMILVSALSMCMAVVVGRLYWSEKSKNDGGVTRMKKKVNKKKAPGSVNNDNKKLTSKSGRMEVVCRVISGIR